MEKKIDINEAEVILSQVGIFKEAIEAYKNRNGQSNNLLDKYTFSNDLREKLEENMNEQDIDIKNKSELFETLKTELRKSYRPKKEYKSE